MSDIFGAITKQLSLQSLGRSDETFYITKQEFNQFKKECVFYKLKDQSIGQVFLEKYKQINGVLSILDGESALRHIEKFYVR